MPELLEEPIRRFLRVPPRPSPPIGAAASLEVFRAAPAFYRYRLLIWGLSQGGALIGLIAGVALFGRFWQEAEFVQALPQFLRIYLPGGLWVIEALAVAGYLLQLPFSFLLVALDYRYRWYLTTDRSLRIREGIWKVQEKTMTFSNIQNVSIRQGPIQRLLGISDLQVRTAGGGSGEGKSGEESGGDNLHVGRFRGVDNAEEIRDSILAKLRRLRASGLGDPDEREQSAPAAEPAASDLQAAADELLRQTRALAAVLRR